MKTLALFGILALAVGLAVAQTAQVELYHDKANWNPNYDKIGEMAGKAGVGFKGVPYQDTSSYQAAIRTSLGSNKAPGLFTWWSGYRMKDLVEAGLVEDVSSIWDKYIRAGEYSKDLAKGFTFNGKVYAIPNLIAYWVVFYNKKAYSDAGIKPPTTWAQLESNNAKLKAKGITAFGQTTEGRWPAFIWFQEFLMRQSVDFYEKLMEGKAKYTDPQVKRTFSTWKSWIDKGYLTDPSVGFGTAGTNALASQFAQGKVANILVGDWYAGTLQEAGMKPGTDYGVFIMPNQSAKAKPAVIFESGPILIAKNAPNKADALKVADYWMSVDAQKVWTDLQSFTPANKKVKPDNAVTAGIVKEVADKDYQLVNRIWEATPTEIIEAAVDEFGKFMVNPASANEVETNVEKLAADYWSKHK